MLGLCRAYDAMSFDDAHHGRVGPTIKINNGSP